MPKCSTCRHKAAPGRKVCNTCRSKAYRKKDPVGYAYRALKANAKRRKKPFSITLTEFKTFCVATDYIAGKGRTVNSFSVDRIDNEKGYELNNIQVLTVSQNIKKLHYNWQTGEAAVEKLQ